jgi:hypothetical protein
MCLVVGYATYVSVVNSLGAGNPYGYYAAIMFIAYSVLTLASNYRSITSKPVQLEPWVMRAIRRVGLLTIGFITILASAAFVYVEVHGVDAAIGHYYSITVTPASVFA